MRQLPFEYAYRNLGRSRARLLASLLGSALVVLLVEIVDQIELGPLLGAGDSYRASEVEDRRAL